MAKYIIVSSRVAADMYVAFDSNNVSVSDIMVMPVERMNIDENSSVPFLKIIYLLNSGSYAPWISSLVGGLHSMIASVKLKSFVIV